MLWICIYLENVIIAKQFCIAGEKTDMPITEIENVPNMQTDSEFFEHYWTNMPSNMSYYPLFQNNLGI